MAAAPLFNKPEAIARGGSYDYHDGGYAQVAMTTDSLVEELMPTLSEIQTHMLNGAEIAIKRLYSTKNGSVEIQSWSEIVGRTVCLTAHSKDVHGQWHHSRDIYFIYMIQGRNFTRGERIVNYKKGGGVEREEGTELLDARQFGQQPVALPAQNGDGPDRPAHVEQKSDGAGAQSGNGAKLG